MKNILLLLFFVPFFSSAQDCKVKKEKDQFSQEEKLTTGFIQLDAAGNKTLLSIDATSKEVDLFFSLNNGKERKCFDDNSTVTAIFEDGKSKAVFRHGGTVNCEGYFHIVYRNTTTTPVALQRFSTKKVKTLKFVNDDVTTEVNLTPEEQQKLMNIAICIAAEAKTLIK